MANQIEIIARGVCIREDRVLVCRSVAGGYCYLPGGHVEFGETAQFALSREVSEETGFESAVGDLLGVDECRFAQAGKSGKLKPRHEINLLYELQLLPRGTKCIAVPSLEPHIDFRWVWVVELLAANFKPESIRLRIANIVPRGKKQKV